MAGNEPQITRITAASGRAVGRLRPGMVIRVSGSGFGERAEAVTVCFDEVEVQPLEMGFSDSSLLVTAPLPPQATDSVTIRVGELESPAFRCRLIRPGLPRQPLGEPTRRYFDQVGEFGSMVAALSRQLGPATPFARELESTANQLDGFRTMGQRTTELMGQWIESQEQYRSLRVPFEAIQTVRRTDEYIVATGGLTEIGSLTTNVFGPSSALGDAVTSVGSTVAEFLFGETAGEIVETIFSTSLTGVVGFILHEASKLLEGRENFLKIFLPSVSIDGGGSLGGELTVGVDVSFSPGEFVSGIAKLVDIVAQYFISVGDAADAAALRRQIEGLEAKLDTSATVISGLVEAVGLLEGKDDRALVVLAGIADRVDQLEEKADRGEGKLDRLESKADLAESKLDVAAVERATLIELVALLEGKADRAEGKLDGIGAQLGIQEEKLDRQEGKLDRLEEKADRGEEKLDRAEGKLDALETKADRAEGKLDVLETKADRAEGKLDVLESKADRGEQKLDAVETKADRAEQKLDALETKADRAEQKLDRQETKLDRAETKLDRAEQKLDRQEAKLDQLDDKADREEVKLDSIEDKTDRQEMKLDRIEGKVDRVEGKNDAIEIKIDFIEEKLDRQEVKLDRLETAGPVEGAVATQQGDGTNLIAAVTSTGARDNEVYLRAAVDQPPEAIDDPAAWSDWVSFGRPQTAFALVETSVDVGYAENSDTVVSALLTARDAGGNVFHRGFEGQDQAGLLDPDQWTEWQSFLQQP